MAIKKHKYVLLSEKLKTKFLRQKPHSQIPSVRQLATLYGVSSMTVRQALSELHTVGLIYSIPGSGTYIAGEKLAKKLVFISFSEEIREKGMTPSSLILKAEKVVITDSKLAQILQISVGDPAYRIKRVRLADNVPMTIEDAFVPRENAPGLLDQNLDGSLYEIFRDAYEHEVILADVDTLEAALIAESLGCDAIATTLAGYTENSVTTLPDIQLISEIANKVKIPVIAEGGFSDPESVARAFAAGAWSVCVGTAITNPYLLTKQFMEAIN